MRTAQKDVFQQTSGTRIGAGIARATDRMRPACRSRQHLCHLLFVEASKRGPVAAPRRSHTSRVLRDFRHEPLPRKPGSSARREQFTSVAGPGHAQRISTRS